MAEFIKVSIRFSRHQNILPCIYRCSSEIACFSQCPCILKKNKPQNTFTVYLEISYQVVEANSFTTSDANVPCTETLRNFALFFFLTLFSIVIYLVFSLTFFTIAIYLLFKDYFNLLSLLLRPPLLRTEDCFAMCGQPAYSRGLWNPGTSYLRCQILQDQRLHAFRICSEHIYAQTSEMSKT